MMNNAAPSEPSAVLTDACWMSLLTSTDSPQVENEETLAGKSAISCQNVSKN
jgi:hypothetical protein